MSLHLPASSAPWQLLLLGQPLSLPAWRTAPPIPARQAGGPVRCCSLRFTGPAGRPCRYGALLFALWQAGRPVQDSHHPLFSCPAGRRAGTWPSCPSLSLSRLASRSSACMCGERRIFICKKNVSRLACHMLSFLYLIALSMSPYLSWYSQLLCSGLN